MLFSRYTSFVQMVSATLDSTLSSHSSMLFILRNGCNMRWEAQALGCRWNRMSLLCKERKQSSSPKEKSRFPAFSSFLVFFSHKTEWQRHVCVLRYLSTQMIPGEIDMQRRKSHSTSLSPSPPPSPCLAQILNSCFYCLF